MLVSELTTQLCREWSEATAGDSSKVTLVESWIKNALDDYALRMNIRAFRSTAPFSTVAGTAEYTLPVAARDIVSMRIPAQADAIIDSNTIWTIENSSRDLTLQGLPRWWYFSNSGIVSNQTALKFKLYPVPDAIYSITVSTIIHPASLTSNSVLPIHNESIAIISDKVRYYMAIDDKDYDAAQLSLGDYERKIQFLTNREQRSTQRYRTLSRNSDVPLVNKERFAILPPDHFHN